MRLKFVSLNTWFGGKLWDPMVAFLQAENPDILALQDVQYTHDPFASEKRFKTLDVLSPKLSLPHRMFAPTFSYRDSGKEDTKLDFGNGILSRMTLIRTDNWFYPGTHYDSFGHVGEFETTQCPRGLQYALIQINEKKLHIFNTQGLWGKDGNDTPERLAASAFILEKIGDNKPAILCGDFNTDQTSQSMKHIAAKMHDVFAEDKRTTSFNVERKPKDSGYKNAVVDFIFTTPDIKILSHSTAQVDVSDHLPLLMEFEI
jgi:endonuclease/exonuclease/phosphatase family metal-dependent hydrolase